MKNKCKNLNQVFLKLALIPLVGDHAHTEAKWKPILGKFLLQDKQC